MFFIPATFFPSMEHSPDHGQHAPSSSSSSTVTNLPSSSSSSSSSRSGAHEEEGSNGQRNDETLHHHQHQQEQQQPSGVFYHLNISISNVARFEMRDDLWSCVLLIIFWFSASMTLILGYYGPMTLKLGPNCSRLIQPNSFFVQSIQLVELDKQKPSLMVYGLRRPSPSDVEISWTETHIIFVPPNFHKEWLFHLNKGSKLNISYTISSVSSLPLALVIAQGAESLLEWVQDPSYPNTTLSWNIIYGSGKIQQEIPKSSNYYIAVGNLNSEEAEIHLNFSVSALIYDTSQAYYRCSLGNQLCSLELYLLGENAAVLSSPAGNEESLNNIWYVKVSYRPRWITYFVGSGVMTILILTALRFCKMCQNSDEPRFHARETGTERAPLLPAAKDDDISSWGSSYESASHDEEDHQEQWPAATSIDGNPLNEGKSNDPRHLCVVCFDAPRDCFFLPCGHCATCFTCGTRIAEDAATCPICRRKMKKARKVFTV